MNDMTLPPVGHNNPPATVAEEMAAKHNPLITRASEIYQSANDAPKTITNDEDAGKVLEVLKAARALKSDLESAADAEKAPASLRISQINGFFKTTIDKIEAIRKEFNTLNTNYLQKKKDEEAARLRRIEEEKREAARLAQKKKDDAEETKRAAAFALEELQRLTEQADRAKKAASSELELADAVVAEKKASLARVRSEIADQNADFKKRIAADENVPTDAEISDAKAAAEAKLVTAKNEVAAAEAARDAAQEKAIEARKEAKRLEDEETAKARVVRQAAAEETQANKEVERNTKAADKIAAKADGPDADLARTRSIHGAVGTLQRRWVSTVIDRDKLDKEALWPFINGEAIQAALWKWMMAQAPEARVMTGAIMGQESEGQVR